MIGGGVQLRLLELPINAGKMPLAETGFQCP